MLVSQAYTKVAMQDLNSILPLQHHFGNIVGGVYWKPIYNVLDGQFKVLVVNAQHIKAVPGRKTDVRDAEWIADLLQHGLLRGSAIPDKAQRELRELTRYRSTLVAERARIVNRVHKVLEDTNLKLTSVVTDVMGVSGRAILAHLLEGQTDPTLLAELARGRLREKRDQLQQALVGVVTSQHRFLLTEHLSHIDFLDEAIDRVSTEIDAALRPHQEEIARLDTIPGVSQRIAQVLLAEVGTDLTRFSTARHLASLAGMCPGNHESADKQRQGTTRPGNPWLRQVLIEAAHGAARSKNTYLSAQFHRLVKRCGKYKALIAVGHSILVIMYHLLTRKQDYVDLGANYFDERERQAVERRLVHRLERLGYQVSLTPPSASA